jgi:hypothetical protein
MAANGRSHATHYLGGAQKMSWESRVALRCASIICAVPTDSLDRLSRALIDVEGEEQFRLLVEGFYNLDSGTRAAIVSRMKPARRLRVRVVRE